MQDTPSRLCAAGAEQTAALLRLLQAETPVRAKRQQAMEKSFPPALAVFCLVASFAGGFVAQATLVTAAHAQTVTVGPGGGQNRQNLSIESGIRVPEEGLGFFNSGGKKIAELAVRGGNATFALLDPGGRPAVLLTGGGSTIRLSAATPGGELTMGAGNQSFATLTGNPNEAGLTLLRTGQPVAALTAGAPGGSLRLNTGRGLRAMSLVSDPAGPIFTMARPDGQVIVSAQNDPALGGTLRLTGISPDQTATLHGIGQILFMKSGQKTLELPSPR